MSQILGKISVQTIQMKKPIEKTKKPTPIDVIYLRKNK